MFRAMSAWFQTVRATRSMRRRVMRDQSLKTGKPLFRLGLFSREVAIKSCPIKDKFVHNGTGSRFRVIDLPPYPFTRLHAAHFNGGRRSEFRSPCSIGH